MKTKFKNTAEKLEYLESRRILIDGSVNKDFLNTYEFEALYDMSLSRQARLRIEDDPIPFFKKGAFVYYRKKDVEKWLQSE